VTGSTGRQSRSQESKYSDPTVDPRVVAFMPTHQVSAPAGGAVVSAGHTHSPHKHLVQLSAAGAAGMALSGLSVYSVSAPIGTK
jgi:hypothetical protein